MYTRHSDSGDLGIAAVRGYDYEGGLESGLITQCCVLAVAIYARSDCSTWPQGTSVRGAEAMGAAREVPVAVSPPSCFGVMENRLAFGARDYGHVLSGLHNAYPIYFLWPAIR